MTFALRALPLRALPFAVLGLATAATAAPLPAAPSVPASPEMVRTVSDGGDCGWFTIVASSRRYNGVSRAAANAGGYVLDTDHVPEFAPNLYAAVRGPNGKSRARSLRNQLRKSGFGDAYIKFGCYY